MRKAKFNTRLNIPQTARYPSKPVVSSSDDRPHTTREIGSRDRDLNTSSISEEQYQRIQANLSDAERWRSPPKDKTSLDHQSKEILSTASSQRDLHSKASETLVRLGNLIHSYENTTNTDHDLHQRLEEREDEEEEEYEGSRLFASAQKLAHRDNDEDGGGVFVDSTYIVSQDADDRALTRKRRNSINWNDFYITNAYDEEGEAYGNTDEREIFTQNTLMSFQEHLRAHHSRLVELKKMYERISLTSGDSEAMKALKHYEQESSKLYSQLKKTLELLEVSEKNAYANARMTFLSRQENAKYQRIIIALEKNCMHNEDLRSKAKYATTITENISVPRARHSLFKSMNMQHTKSPTKPSFQQPRVLVPTSTTDNVAIQQHQQQMKASFADLKVAHAENVTRLKSMLTSIISKNQDKVKCIMETMSSINPTTFPLKANKPPTSLGNDHSDSQLPDIQLQLAAFYRDLEEDLAEYKILAEKMSLEEMRLHKHFEAKIDNTVLPNPSPSSRSSSRSALHVDLDRTNTTGGATIPIPSHALTSTPTLPASVDNSTDKRIRELQDTIDSLNRKLTKVENDLKLALTENKMLKVSVGLYESERGGDFDDPNNIDLGCLADQEEKPRGGDESVNMTTTSRLAEPEVKIEEYQDKIAEYEKQINAMLFIENFYESLREEEEENYARRRQQIEVQHHSMASPSDVFPPNVPSGKVALVFTDVQDSTRLWERSLEGTAAAIKLHNQVMRECLQECQGYEVKTEGDAFMIAFSDSMHAVQFGLMVQLRLLEADWPPDVLKIVEELTGTYEEKRDADAPLLWRGLRVRMGIHVGEPIAELDPVTKRYDYFGPVVNRAARVEGTAKGGQINISSVVWDEIKDRLSEFQVPVFTKDLGEITLKGLHRPEHVRMILPMQLKDRTWPEESPMQASIPIVQFDKFKQARSPTIINIKSRVTKLLEQRDKLTKKLTQLKEEKQRKAIAEEFRQKDEIINNLKTELAKMQDERTKSPHHDPGSKAQSTPASSAPSRTGGALETVDKSSSMNSVYDKLSTDNIKQPRLIRGGSLNALLGELHERLLVMLNKARDAFKEWRQIDDELSQGQDYKTQPKPPNRLVLNFRDLMQVDITRIDSLLDYVSRLVARRSKTMPKLLPRTNRTLPLEEDTEDETGDEGQSDNDATKRGRRPPPLHKSKSKSNLNIDEILKPTRMDLEHEKALQRWEQKKRSIIQQRERLYMHAIKVFNDDGTPATQSARRLSQPRNANNNSSSSSNNSAEQHNSSSTIFNNNDLFTPPRTSQVSNNNGSGPRSQRKPYDIGSPGLSSTSMTSPATGLPVPVGVPLIPLADIAIISQNAQGSGRKRQETPLKKKKSFHHLQAPVVAMSIGGTIGTINNNNNNTNDDISNNNHSHRALRFPSLAAKGAGVTNNSINNNRVAGKNIAAITRPTIVLGQGSIDLIM